MNRSKKILKLFIFALLFITLSYSYSYFTPKAINNSLLKLSIDDDRINVVDISPIYDRDYELLGIHKNFAIVSNSTLNSCFKLYINIKEISKSLNSEYFKYKIIYDNKEIDGNFLNANNNEKMLLLDNIPIKQEEEKIIDLYIWLSYQDNNQSNLLNSKIKSNLYLEESNSQNNSCSN